ncbi:YSIRK-type signal peptide-containing protein, partial [Staphylococcus epidermidis]|uniref:YSIRK-type signal peptide-containing protein n=1 Tax=Staphylococcus epidermidis TaxID=1282 RepID=UPI000A9A6C0D
MKTYSIRKFKTVVGSIAVGTIFFIGGHQAEACDEISEIQESVTSSDILITYQNQEPCDIVPEYPTNTGEEPCDIVPEY